MSAPPDPAALQAALEAAIIELGQDMFAMKLYWVAIVALWFYDYFLTLPDEIEYGWRGKKTPVFVLYFLNRYLPLCFIIITLVAYFLPAFNTQTCSRYGFMETLETSLMTTTAELFLMLRIYALSGAKRWVWFTGGLIFIMQWIIVIYGLSQASTGSDNVALLLSRRAAPPAGPPPLPTLPSIDPYHICIFISALSFVPWVESYVSLSLAFDTLAFIAIIALTAKQLRRQSHFTRIISVIQRDGIMYFFVLFSSNLTWLILVLYARPSLKFLHNQPAMILSAIMINRITLNLKVASTPEDAGTFHTASHTKLNSNWSVRTFESVPGSTGKRSYNPSTQMTSMTTSSSRFGTDDLEMNSYSR